MPITNFLNTSLIQLDQTSSTAAHLLNTSLIVNDASTPKNLTYFNLSLLAVCAEYINLSVEDNTHRSDRDTGINPNTQQETPGFNIVQGRCKTFSKYDSDRFLNTSLIQLDQTSSTAAHLLNTSLIVNDASTPKNLTYFNLSLLAVNAEYFNLSLEEGEQTTADWLILYDNNGNAKNSIAPQNGSATIE
jgi:hypothetical protein